MIRIDSDTHFTPLDAFADLFDAADDLVPGNERQFRIGQFSIDQMQIGAANRARLNADEQLFWARFWYRHIALHERVSQFLENHRAHVD